MSGRMKEWYRSKKLLENKVGFVSKTEFRVWPQNRASAFSRPNPQGLNDDDDDDEDDDNDDDDDLNARLFLQGYVLKIPTVPWFC